MYSNKEEGLPRGTFTLKKGEEPDAIRKLWGVGEVGLSSLPTLTSGSNTAQETLEPLASLLSRDLTKDEEELVKQGLEENEGTKWDDVVARLNGDR
jgi:hypothetical protein